jgi:hypothetical protein
MVLVHGTYQKSVSIMIPELHKVVALPTGSGVYIKWDTCYLIRDDLRIVV